MPKIIRDLQRIIGRREDRDESTVRKFMAKFEETFSVNVVLTPTRQKKVIKNIIPALSTKHSV